MTFRIGLGLNIVAHRGKNYVLAILASWRTPRKFSSFHLNIKTKIRLSELDLIHLIQPPR